MYHIAQVNIAQLLAPEGDPKVAGFFDNIERINSIADASDGFVWRYDGEYGDNPLQVFNLSVWQDIESLAQFVYRSAHVDILRQKAQWMRPMDSEHSALWWVEQGHIPSPDEAILKLQHLNICGPSAQAFTFTHRYSAPKH